MNIQVRVLSAQAVKQIRDLEAELARVRAQTVRTGVAMDSMGTRGIPGLSKWGNQVQWAGRQLQYNFTLPLLLAGGAAAKFELDNQKAMTRVIKVYGDGSAVFNKLSQTEIPALGRAFEALSNQFGIAQSDVINIAADWAAAGASGLALAKSVKLTLETMILGELDAADATESLIAIQAQYGESVKDLAQTIDILNMVENQTGASMKGLIQGFVRAAGVARSAGIDARHLAAMMAAMTPAAGSAAQAGNALKTIISRLLSPTKEAAEVMGLMGINTKSMAWQSLNGTQRMEKMAVAFKGLDSAQKAVVSSVIASRYQINKFDVAMRDLANTNGYYQKSLEATESASRNYAQRQRELNAVLNSNPQRLKQMWTILQNAMADVIQPMIPSIVALAGSVAHLATWFANLDPNVQKLILGFAIFIAAIGPIARYVGSVANLLGLLSEAARFAGRNILGLAKSFGTLVASPFRLVGQMIGAVVGMLGTIGSALGGMILRAAGGSISAAGATLGGLFSRAFMGTMALMRIGVLRVFGLMFGGATMGIVRQMSLNIGRIFMAGFGQWTGAVGAIWMRFWRLLPVAMGASTGAMSATWALFSRTMAATWTATTIAMSRIWGATVATIRLGFAMIRGSAALTTGALAITRGALLGISGAGAVAVRGAGAVSASLAALPRLVTVVVGGLSRLPGMIVGLFTRIGPMLLRIAPFLLRAATGWIGLAVTAGIGLLYAFRNQIADIWNNIVGFFRGSGDFFAPVVNLWMKGVKAISDMFWKLPASVRDAIITVVKIIRDAALQVYEWFSYLNPFAHHSPSLVEQVVAGMAVVKAQYASVSNVGTPFAKAARDLAAFKNAVSALNLPGEFADQRVDVAKAFPGMLPLFDALIGDIKALKGVLAQQEAAVNKQQAVVDRWKASLDAANKALDAEQAKLDGLQKKLDALNNSYQQHEQAMQNYAAAPIAGMGKMNDAIFANEMAQKKLRLEMLKMEDANGTLDDMKSRMAALQGSIEQLRGTASDLRGAGAGSDVLGPINDQIKGMEAEYAKIEKTAQNNPMSELQKQMDELQRKGEILDLEKSIKFDPLTRKIEQLTNTMKEMPFDQIVAGVKREQAAMAVLQPQIDAATAAVNKQKAAVDQATAARDAISARYDAEDAKLQKLKDSYQQTEDAIRNIESALRDMGTAASAEIQKAEDAARKAKQAKGPKANELSPGAQNFLDAAGANFPDVGGNAKIGREGGLGDQSKAIDDFTKQMTDDMKNQFGKIDMFKPIKDMWNKAWKWVEDNVAPKVGPVVDSVKGIWNDITNAFQNSSIPGGLSKTWDGITVGAKKVVDFLKGLWKLFGEDFRQIVSVLVEKGKEIWNKIGPEVVKFRDLLPGLTKILGFLWDAFKVVAAVVGGVLIFALKLVTSILSETLGPVIDLIIGLWQNFIKIVRGVIEFLVGVFTGNWSQAWQGIKDIVSGIFGAIWEIIKGFGKTIWGVVKGIVYGIKDFFAWLRNILVGHSIVPDMINEIVAWFKKLPGMAWNALVSLKDKIVSVVTNAFNAFISKAKQLWGSFTGWLKTLPQNAYNNFITIKDKLTTASSIAWNAFWTKAKGVWSSVTTWIKGLPSSAYNSIASLTTKLSTAASNAFNALKNKAKDIVDGRSGFMTWVAGIPGRIAKALGGVGSAVANAVKGSWNGAADWLNKHAMGNLNKVTSKFGFNMPELPRFAGGGVIPGRVSKRDNTLIAARTGEGVIVPELVKAMGGARGLNTLNDAARRGNIKKLTDAGLPGYAGGGVIGDWLQRGTGFALSKILSPVPGAIRSLIPGKPFAEDYLAGNAQHWVDAAKKWGSKKDEAGNKKLDGYGWQKMVAILKAQFPNIVITSTNRPGAITASGNTSYHAMGRAVDMAPSMEYFNWLVANYGKSSKEIIYSPANGRQIKNGKPYMYTGAVRDMHFNHVHWAYDKGGILKPGLTMAYNGTGRDEVTLTNDQWQSISNVVSMMDRNVQKSMSTPTPGASMVARTGATVASLEARLRNATPADSTVRNTGSGARTVNINGDLVLPNIKNGNDAETFLRHLESLAG